MSPATSTLKCILFLRGLVDHEFLSLSPSYRITAKIGKKCSQKLLQLTAVFTCYTKALIFRNGELALYLTRNIFAKLIFHRAVLHVFREF